MQINTFENFPLNYAASAQLLFGANTSFGIHMVYIPGTISMNSIFVLFNGIQGAANTRSLTFSFGFYSLTGSTLTLLNSASKSSTFVPTDALSYFSLILSTTSVVNPGNYYFFFASSRTGGAGGAGYGFVANNFATAGPNAGLYGSGPLFRGYLGSAGLPASINTATPSVEGVAGVDVQFPYILISA